MTPLAPYTPGAGGAAELTRCASALLEVLAGARPWCVELADAEFLVLPPESVDAVIADPPAGIKFMGREWDSDKGGEEQWTAWLSRCMARAFEALKPGGHAIVWALPRTSDWTAQALRRAGFNIIDTIDHVFASGFPKSMSIQKAIESMVVAPATEGRRWKGWGTALKPAKEVWWVCRKPLIGTYASNVLRFGTGGINVDAGRVGTDWSDRSDSWKNSGRSAKPEADKIAAPPGNGINCHPSGRWPANFVLSHASWDESACACGLVLPCIVAFCPACGSGEVEHRRGGCRCVGERKVKAAGPANTTGSDTTAGVYGSYGSRSIVVHRNDDGIETVDAWECLATCDACGLAWLALEGGPEPVCECGQQGRWACPVAALDAQSGERTSGARAPGVRRGIGWNGIEYGDGGPAVEASTGGASRFFHCFAPDPIEPFFFSAKPSASETEAGCEDLKKGPARGALNTKNGTGERLDGKPTPVRGNTHPTRKSLALVGHFCDLFLPPGGVALDPFGGSGPLAAVVAHRHHVTGWRAIVTEISPEYVEIGRARARHWGARPWRPARVVAPSQHPQTERQQSLFSEE